MKKPTHPTHPSDPSRINLNKPAKFSITIALLVALVGIIALMMHKSGQAPTEQRRFPYNLGQGTGAGDYPEEMEQKVKQRQLERSSSSSSMSSPIVIGDSVADISMESVQMNFDQGQAVANIAPRYATVPQAMHRASGMGMAFMGAARPVPSANESYAKIKENKEKKALEEPLSTVSIDVDTASYANCRRMLRDDQAPPKNAVRIEEFVNYFNYDYPQPKGDVPFSVTCELSTCPWNDANELLLVGFQAKKVNHEELPPANLVFLADTSGSMDSYDKLPLLQKSMKVLVKQLREQDKIAIVTYAGSAGLALPATSGAQKGKILAAINNMQAGGSTAGSAGIQLAYKIAAENFDKDGLNRFILATDGDFNVGPSSDSAMKKLIKEKRKSGIFLSVLGFGTGNLKDSKMETLADNGNGNYGYIDSFLEAKKQLADEFGGTLMTVAKDVKFQIEFNPHFVDTYRLIGYENRILAKEDFANDKKDAGDMGAGHSVTALYEIRRAKQGNASQDLAFQEVKLTNKKDFLFCKLRYKEPDASKSKLVEIPYPEAKISRENPSANHLFASAVAEFGLLLRDSKHKTHASVENLAARVRRSIKVGNIDESSSRWAERTAFLTLVNETRHTWDSSHLNSFIPRN